MINEVTLRQFNGYCYIRDPVINVFSSEVSWFEAYNKKVIGIIVYDFTDKDYGFVILGRDQRKVFRCIETSKIFYENESIAKKELFLGFEKYQNDEKEFYIQGDETEPINEFLVPKVPISQLHPYFRVLSEDKRYEAARNLISEIIYSYIDIDGNYIKDFQTTGFNGRLWELFLYIYLHRAHFSIDRTIKVPDYSANFFGAQYFIEAVTINPSQKYDQPYPTNQIDIINLNRDYMPIKYGMALMTKLRKKYWEKDHVKSNPLIFAIHDFHFEASDNNIGSMTWSRTALENYLYGIRPIYEIDENNLINYKLKDTENGIEPIYEIIESHTWDKKTIPSNFFGQLNSENVSAVLYSNGATLATFNRMGKLAGLGGKDITILRTMVTYDPNPYATAPNFETVNIDDPKYEESWSDTITMYHNPNAKYPVDTNSFPDITHMFLNKDKNILYGHIPPYSVLSSFSITILSEKFK